MRQYTAPILSIALLFLLFGCTQGGIPPSCAQAPSGNLANCVYVSSVLEQNPYTCYSIKDMAQREKCIRDASDSAAKGRLELMSDSERAKIFADANAIGAPIDVIPPLPVAGVPAAQDSEPAANPFINISQVDAQFYEQAVASNDIVPCTVITDASTRASCIAQVAIKVKRPDECSRFTLKADVDLCNLYSTGN